MNTQTTRNKVTSRIYGKKRGWVFTSSDFCDIGSILAVRKTLERLTQKEVIRRLGRGLYDYPRLHQVIGKVAPNYREVGKAFARKNKCRILPSGGYAANALGINLDVPAKTVFLTDGPTRKLKCGNREFFFVRTTPKSMAVSSEISGMVIHGLKYMKKRYVDSQVIDQLKRVLDKKQKYQILKDISCAPAWIAQVIKKVVTIDYRAY